MPCPNATLGNTLPINRLTRTNQYLDSVGAALRAARAQRARPSNPRQHAHCVSCPNRMVRTSCPSIAREINVRARLQSCQKCRQRNAALAAEGLLLPSFPISIFQFEIVSFPLRLREPLRDCHKSNSLSEPLKGLFGRARRVRLPRTQAPGVRSAKRRCLSACQTRFPCTLARVTNPRPRAAKRHRCLAAGRFPKRTTLPRNPRRATSRNHRRGSAYQLQGSQEERPQERRPRRSPLAKWGESCRQQSERVPRRALQRKIPATAPRAIAKVEECQKAQQAGFGNQPLEDVIRAQPTPS